VPLAALHPPWRRLLLSGPRPGDRRIVLTTAPPGMMSTCDAQFTGQRAIGAGEIASVEVVGSWRLGESRVTRPRCGLRVVVCELRGIEQTGARSTDP
jgi:hypothetical protein